MTAVRVPLCSACAAKLREIRDRKGDGAMVSAMGRILCPTCRQTLAALGGPPTDARLRVERSPDYRGGKGPR